MKTKLLFHLSIEKVAWLHIAHAFEAADCAELLEDPPPVPYIDWKMDEEDPRLPSLRLALQGIGLCPKVSRRWREYTSAELRSAFLLALGVNRPELDIGGPSHGTQYDLSTACPHCGTGATQSSNLLIRQPKLDQSVGLICTLDDEYLAASLVAEAFRNQGITGCELRQTLDWKKRCRLPWWQIIPVSHLPPMSVHTKGVLREEPCKWCQRDGHYHSIKVPIELTYERRVVDPDQLPDVVHSWECFGLSVLHDDPERELVRHFATPLIMVKPRVMDLLSKLGIKRLVYRPVKLV